MPKSKTTAVLSSRQRPSGYLNCAATPGPLPLPATPEPESVEVTPAVRLERGHGGAKGGGAAGVAEGLAPGERLAVGVGEGVAVGEEVGAGVGPTAYRRQAPGQAPSPT
jgi:hypothetical protein